jgi:hypothetical protein
LLFLLSIIAFSTTLAFCAEQETSAEFFYKFSAIIYGYNDISEVVGELGQPTRTISSSPDTADYIWERKLTFGEDEIQTLINIAVSGSKVLSSNIEVFFEDGDSVDFEKIHAFFITTCKEYEKTTKSVPKIRLGGGYGWRTMQTMYPHMVENYYLSVELNEDEEYAGMVFRVISGQEAKQKILRFSNEDIDVKPELHTQPNVKSPVVGQPDLGMEFYVLETKNVKGMKYPWYSVRAVGNASEKGWIYGEYMSPLREMTVAEAEKMLKGGN